jgi:hypothetical protein
VDFTLGILAGILLTAVILVVVLRRYLNGPKD